MLLSFSNHELRNCLNSIAAVPGHHHAQGRDRRKPIALGVEEAAQPDGGGRVIIKSRVSTTYVDYSVQNLGTNQPVSYLSNGPTEFDQKMGKKL